jgi:hypothetical protein
MGNSRYFCEVKEASALIPVFFKRYADSLKSATEKQAQYSHEVATRAMFDRMKTDTKQYVPWKTGALAKSTRYHYHSTEDFQVSYGAGYGKYAVNPIAPSGKRKQYTHTVHPLASGYPLETATEIHKNEWLHVYDDTFRGLMSAFFAK